MLMTTNKLLILRVYMVSFGRWAFFANILRTCLKKLLVTSKGKAVRYGASSRFFDERFFV